MCDWFEVVIFIHILECIISLTKGRAGGGGPPGRERRLRHAPAAGPPLGSLPGLSNYMFIIVLYINMLYIYIYIHIHICFIHR